LRALAELVTICAGALTICGFTVRYVMDRLGRKRLPPESTRDHVKQIPPTITKIAE